MTNLAGHDLPTLVEAFSRIDHDRPACFICYTIKGFGLPFAGHKDNHAGLMTPAQMESFRQAMNIRPGPRMGALRRLEQNPERLQDFLDKVPFAAGGPRRLTAPRFPAPNELAVNIQPEMSTQSGFGVAAQRTGAREIRTRRPYRHDLARRDGLDQSRAVGEPPRPVRARSAGRHVQERAHPVDVQLGVLGQRASTSSSASPR